MEDTLPPLPDQPVHDRAGKLRKAGRVLFVLLVTGALMSAVWNIMSPVIVGWFPVFQTVEVHSTDHVVQPNKIIRRVSKETQIVQRTAPAGVTIIETRVIRRVVVETRVADKAADTTHKENKNAIAQIPGGDEPVPADRWNAIVDGLCKYPVYQADPQCVELRKSNP